MNNIVPQFLILIIVCLLVAIVYLNKNTKNSRTKYHNLMNYLEQTDELLEEYRIKTHSFKNNLIVASSMIKEKKYKELDEYINTLLSLNQNKRYYWVDEIKYIPLAGLKGFINYKINEFNLSGINIQITISQDVKNFDFSTLNSHQKDSIYNIIGIFLDNARDASLLSREPKIVIDIYLDSDAFAIEIANTYANFLNFDMMGKLNYSTKGRNRGIGLHTVNKILKSESIFRTERKIKDQYFIQKFIIKHE